MSGSLVYPELLSGRDDEETLRPWTVHEGSTVRGAASCNLTDRILEVPLGAGDQARVVRAHELMHAYHAIRGTQAGMDRNHFTTTAAELLCTGIAPFALEPVSENAVRTNYAAIAAALIDPSNVWGAPARRTTYDAPPAGETPQTMRAQLHCI